MMPSSVLLTIASSDDSTIAASQPAARASLVTVRRRAIGFPRILHGSSGALDGFPKRAAGTFGRIRYCTWADNVPRVIDLPTAPLKPLRVVIAEDNWFVAEH